MPIDIAAYSHQIIRPDCGGFVTFEGRVRNHHLGRPVKHLVYDAYPEMVEAEGVRLLAEISSKYDIESIQAVHRIGQIEVCECAVWIGVSAHHRDAAFAAANATINELKKRLPIWKHEFYKDGTSEWVACHHSH